MPMVHVIQRPRRDAGFDLEALKALGTVNFILPGAPNVHDQERMTSDLKTLVRTIRGAQPGDVFVSLGGHFLSHALFGSAFSIAGCAKINYGMFIRTEDKDGRKSTSGTYRVIPIDLGITDEALALL